jgi:hypothetical protein
MTVATITAKTETNFHETFFNDLIPYLCLAIRFKILCRESARVGDRHTAFAARAGIRRFTR